MGWLRVSHTARSHSPTKDAVWLRNQAEDTRSFWIFCCRLESVARQRRRMRKGSSTTSAKRHSERLPKSPKVLHRPRRSKRRLLQRRTPPRRMLRCWGLLKESATVRGGLEYKGRHVVCTAWYLPIQVVQFVLGDVDQHSFGSSRRFADAMERIAPNSCFEELSACDQRTRKGTRLQQFFLELAEQTGGVEDLFLLANWILWDLAFNGQRAGVSDRFKRL